MEIQCEGGVCSPGYYCDAHGVIRPTTDTLSQRGAMALAKKLQDYWHVRGYDAARFWAVPVDERFAKIGTYEVYRVESNLVNGLPPRYREENG